MTSKRKKILKIAALLAIAGLLIGAGVAYYMYNMPHRDVQSTTTDYKLTVSELINEYANNQDAANAKYLAEDGNSKILEVTGEVLRSRTNMNNQLVLVLQNPGDIAGVNVTFGEQASQETPAVEKGQIVTIKGVIRSGVYYDDNLSMYVNANIDHAALIQ
ncbi:MAG: OB-fold putative lipoprotein [Bacteroidales bacterium]|nr:OB-fold putative lipoprotein [Bacteroidales bacterium]